MFMYVHPYIAVPAVTGALIRVYNDSEDSNEGGNNS